ncbi:MAG: ABC transporter transmembrane domain-containing protein, partial [Lachnospiraceae bacterium]
MSVNSAGQDELQREVPKTETLLRLFGYLLACKKELVIAVAFTLVTLVISLVSPLMIEQAVDVYVAGRDVNGLLRLSAAALVLFLIFWISTRQSMMIMEDVTNRVLLTIRGELYAHVQSLSFHFFDSRPTGKILARIIGDVNSLKEVLADSVTKLIPDLLTVAGVAAIMLVKNWKLAMSALLMLPVLVVCMFVLQYKSHKLWQIRRKKSSNMTAFIHEDISGIRVIQSFAAEKETEEDFYIFSEEDRTSFVNAVRVADL